MNTSLKHDEPNIYWYAIYTKARAERKVFERLLIKGFNAYLPLVTSIRQWSDRKKTIVSPLIPSYVFVQVHKDQLYDTLFIEGTVGFLKYLGKPAIVRDFEIENLKILMNDIQQVSIINETKFEKGEEIEVINGPFKGLKAQLISSNGNNRIVVEIEAMSTKLAVNIPLVFVKKNETFHPSKVQ